MPGELKGLRDFEQTVLNCEPHDLLISDDWFLCELEPTEELWTGSCSWKCWIERIGKMINVALPKTGLNAKFLFRSLVTMCRDESLKLFWKIVVLLIKESWFTRGMQVLIGPVSKKWSGTRNGLIQPAPDRQISEWSIFAVVGGIRTGEGGSDFTSLSDDCYWTTGWCMRLANNHEMVDSWHQNGVDVSEWNDQRLPNEIDIRSRVLSDVKAAKLQQGLKLFHSFDVFLFCFGV